MARTSKKGERKQTATKPVWKAGIYARLSVDSNDRKNESIDTQMEIAKEYIRQTEDIELMDCYIDLGKTGTNFKRADFERMMTDIRQKRINCVIVKDFSRFGRNYIETGNYIEKIFPFLKVRFIAVTDGYDSEHLTGNDSSLSMNLKNIVNELYAKDIAQRVRTAKKQKQEMGSYTGGVAPYGYRVENVGDKKVLFPDINTKDIVMGIFQMYAAGRTYKEIAEDLYKRKIQRPMAYHATGEIYCPKDRKLQQWSYDTIKWILTNPVYIGTLFQTRIGRKSYQEHKLYEIDKKKDVTAVTCTHEPLIAEALFNEVARRFERQRKYSNNRGYFKEVPLNEDIFKGKIYCGKCGRPLMRSSTMRTLSSGNRVRSYYYSCLNKRRIDSSACKCQGISVEALRTIIKAALEKEFSLSEICPKDYYKQNMAEAEKKIDMVEKEKVAIIHSEEAITLEGSRLYAQYREGEFSREEFLERKKKIEEDLAKQDNLKKKLDSRRQMIEKEAKRTNQCIRRLLQYGTKSDYSAGPCVAECSLGMKSGAEEKFDSILVDCLIKKILVYSGWQVAVVFNYKRHDLLYGAETNE